MGPSDLPSTLEAAGGWNVRHPRKVNSTALGSGPADPLILPGLRNPSTGQHKHGALSTNQVSKQRALVSSAPPDTTDHHLVSTMHDSLAQTKTVWLPWSTCRPGREKGSPDGRPHMHSTVDHSCLLWRRFTFHEMSWMILEANVVAGGPCSMVRTTLAGMLRGPPAEG